MDTIRYGQLRITAPNVARMKEIVAEIKAIFEKDGTTLREIKNTEETEKDKVFKLYVYKTPVSNIIKHEDPTKKLCRDINENLKKKNITDYNLRLDYVDYSTGFLIEKTVTVEVSDGDFDIKDVRIREYTVPFVPNK